MKAIAVNPIIEFSNDTVNVECSYGKISEIFTRSTVTVNLQLEAIEENGKLFEVIKPEKWYKASYEDDIKEIKYEYD